jgi:uncharacterized protein (TIGR04255 family)
MAESNTIKIDHDQKFEHLAKAPIIEAVIDIRARVDVPWDVEDIESRLEPLLSDYPNRSKIGSSTLTAELQPPSDGGHAPVLIAAQEYHGWLGIRADSGDGHLIASFTRDGFALSRLAPYQSWDVFREEALRLWKVFCQIANPPGIQRMGVRFINRLNVPVHDLVFSDYFQGMADTPQGLEMAHFLDQQTLAWHGHPGPPYFVKRIRTFQQPEPQNVDSLALLLDIDAFCHEPCEVSVSTMNERLSALHWLKNHVFFSSLTDKALEICR